MTNQIYPVPSGDDTPSQGFSNVGKPSPDHGAMSGLSSNGKDLVSANADQLDRPGAWKKGALHTHSFRSDGEGFPEEVVLAYRTRGYDFVCLTDHNDRGDDDAHWLSVLKPEQGPFAGGLPFVGGCSYLSAVERYRQVMNGDIETKRHSNYDYVRVRNASEISNRFDIPGDFLTIAGVELSHWQQSADGSRRQLHMNVINLERELPLQQEATLDATLKANFTSASAQHSRQAEGGIFICNHPHGYWYDIPPSLLIENWEIQHFELKNSNVDGVGGPESLGQELPYDNEKFWDVVNAFRLAEGHPPLWAAASDDAHFYDEQRIDTRTGVGHSWVMVRVPGLFTRQALVEAMNRGDYYPTTGVEFADIDYSGSCLSVRVKSVPGVRYRIVFKGVRRDFSRSIGYLSGWESPGGRHRRDLELYDDGIGCVFAETSGIEGSYRLHSDELFVRAVVISDRLSSCRSSRYGVYESAFSQPLINTKVL